MRPVDGLLEIRVRQGLTFSDAILRCLRLGEESADTCLVISLSAQLTAVRRTARRGRQRSIHFDILSGRNVPGVILPHRRRCIPRHSAALR